MESTQHVQSLLKYTYGIVPIVAGLDKYFNILVDWSTYVPGFVSNIVPADILMYIVGVIEIAAGILVLSRFTKVGAYVVSAWLVLIALNLMLIQSWDIAVRDLVMAIGAYCLAKLS